MLLRPLCSAALALALVGVSATHAQEPPVDTGNLASGPFATMEGKLEKTVLGVDVLHAQIRFGDETAGDLKRLADGHELDDALEKKLAREAYRAPHAYLRVRFLRDADLDTFVEGARENAKKAHDAGMISEETYRRIYHGLPKWYSFLEERGIEEGDWLLYRAYPDRLRTVFLDHDGNELFDRTDKGARPGRAALAGYFAPDTGLRGPLIASLFED